MYIKIYEKTESVELEDNLFDITNTVDGYVNSTNPFGITSDTRETKTSEFISVKPNTFYQYNYDVTLNSVTGNSYWTVYYFYKNTDEVSDIISEQQEISGEEDVNKSFTFKTPSDCNYIRISSVGLSQIGAEASLYEMTTTGSNLFDLSNCVNGYLHSTKPLSINTASSVYGEKTSDFIAVTPDTFYLYEFDVDVSETDNIYWSVYYFYNDEENVSEEENKRQQVSGANAWDSASFLIKTPSDCNFIRISTRGLNQSGITVSFKEVSISTTNLFEISNTVDGFLAPKDAFIINFYETKTSNYIDVEPNTIYRYDHTVNTDEIGDYWTAFYFYENSSTPSGMNMRQVITGSDENAKTFSFKTPIDCYCIRIGSRGLGKNGALASLKKISPIKYDYLETIYEIGSPTTVHTLNGINKFSCTIPLGLRNINENTFKLMNQIEFYDDNDQLKFGGFLVDRSFSMPDLTIGCYGWGFLFQKVRMTPKKYTMTYSKLMQTLFESYIVDSNYQECGFESNLLCNDKNKVTKEVKATDCVYECMASLADDIGGYLTFNDDKTITYCYEKEQPYMWYAKWEYDATQNILELPTIFNNLIAFPQISQSASELINNGYSEITVNDSLLTCIRIDENSVNMYGLLEGTIDVDDSVTYQTTLDQKTFSELKKISLPQNSISIEIADSILAPLDEIEVGQKITIYIEPYFYFKVTTTILEIQRDYETSTAKLSVGKTLYKQNKPVTINYK